ncbi:MAG: conjugal transfer protein TraX [Lachnospiraceae bacterium]|nr:conjugal transfer protein TraX [Lachnospiraceae bacterium]
MPKKGLSGAALKWIALICMAIDHTGATVVLQYVYRMAVIGAYTQYHNAHIVYDVMRGIGRFSFPVYCFLLVEGFFHTRDRGKYLLNLTLFALISEIPFDLAFSNAVFETTDQNVFLTLAIGLLAIWLADLLRNKVKGRAGRNTSAAGNAGVTKNALPPESLLAADFVTRAAVGLVAVVPAVILAQVLKTDYGGWGVAVIYIFYLLHDWKTLAAAAGVAVLTVMQSIEIYAFPCIPCIYFYNGTRGRQLKYFFYAFYPVHLLILYGVCRVLGYY